MNRFKPLCLIIFNPGENGATVCTVLYSSFPLTRGMKMKTEDK